MPHNPIYDVLQTLKRGYAEYSEYSPKEGEVEKVKTYILHLIKQIEQEYEE